MELKAKVCCTLSKARSSTKRASARRRSRCVPAGTPAFYAINISGQLPEHSRHESAARLHRSARFSDFKPEYVTPAVETLLTEIAP